MRRWHGLFAALFLIISCSAPAAEPTTTASVATTTSRVATTTTSPPQAYEIQGCASPQVTFSPLCEVYELAQEHHIDAPFAPDDLAALALEGLRQFSAQTSEPAPRTVFCAIPDQAFAEFCAQVAHRVGETGLPVGPAVEAAATAMANLGLGAYSYYVPPEEAEAFRANGLVRGVGIMLDATDTAGSKCMRIAAACPLQIVFVLEDNPGEQAGLRAGDRIVSVEGLAVEGQSFTGLAGELAGDETGTVSLTVQRGGETLPIVVERDELQIPSVEIDMPFPGIAYLKIPNFEDDIPGLVHDAVAAIMEADPRTIVVDLRDNPGGYIFSAVEVASEFIPEGVVMVELGADGAEEYLARPGGLATAPGLVVMVNEGTASAAEIFAGALRDRRGAAIVGTTTFGKDAVQIPFPLNNGGDLYVVVARWRTPSGHTVGTDGLVPDRGVDWAAAATLEDAVAAAIEAAS